MSKEVIAIVTLKNGDQQALFECPGCKMAHAPYIKRQARKPWGFNNDLVKPTFTPSILVRRPANPNASEEFKEYRKELRCHSFVREGKIQFLNDCTHELKGQTVALKPL